MHERGEKHCLAIEDDVRESTQSWREVLLKLTSRGMSVPELAIGDGAMGFWAALEEVYPETRQQRGANTAGLKLVNREQKTRIKIRQCKYLNNIIEQDHRRIKRVTRPMLGFKNFYAAQCTRLCENSEFSGFRGCLTPCSYRDRRIQAILGG